MTAAETQQAESPLASRLSTLAKTARLIVATDYDGTIAPIVNDPSQAHPLHEAVVALRALAEIPSTEVVVVSGRSLADLTNLSGLPDTIHMVGSHGSEFDAGFGSALSPEQKSLLAEITSAMHGAASRGSGFRVETKPASVAFHYREADAKTAKEVLAGLEAGIGSQPGVFRKAGKMVLEMTVVETSKGTALQAMRRRLSADAIVFFGDDVTDEDAFKILTGPDLGIKVGPGDTAAHERVDDPKDVTRCLAQLAQQREAWVLGEGAVPINSLSVLSDRRTVAIVSPTARVNWLCAPRIDAPALFAELLGGPSAGHFSVEPADGAAPINQRYREGTLVLETFFDRFNVTDFLDCSGGLPTQRAGRTELVRTIRGEAGAKVRVTFAPRLDFGRMATELKIEDGVGIRISNWPDPIVLLAPGLNWSVREEGIHQTAVAEVELGDEPITLALRYGLGSLRGAQNAEQREDATARYWKQWTEQLELPAIEPDHVRTSALALRSLTYGPTGAMAAAGTTSLPEDLGGIRNWDYRFCWPRDSAVATTALVKLGSTEEAMGFLDWLLGVVEKTSDPSRLNPIYTVAGEELTIEGEIGELSGYAGSRPVRIGNAASRQVQLDEFGPIVDLVCTLAEHDAPLSQNHWRIVEAMVSAVRSKWSEPDHGIWEIRHAPRHHVHSRVMCWFAVDRAIKASMLLHESSPPAWTELADAIKHDILAHGFSEAKNSYVGYYGGTELDAGSLWIGLSGMVDPGDERFIATVNTTEQDLGDRYGIYRYHYDDGLPGQEGVFNICTTWLIRSLLLIGETERAYDWWQRYLGLVGPTGMLAEEHDPERNIALGNVPQAYSHAGLIECAIDFQNAKAKGHA